jgi:hypothetical protein
LDSQGKAGFLTASGSQFPFVLFQPFFFGFADFSLVLVVFAVGAALATGGDGDRETHQEADEDTELAIAHASILV